MLKKFARGSIFFVLGIFLIGLSFVDAPVLSANNSAVVRVDPPTAVVERTTLAVVNVRIENAYNLAGAEVHLIYNAAVLEVDSLEPGGFPAPDFVAQNQYGNGRIDYAIAQMPQQHPPVSGNGTLLRIVFRPRGNGASDLDLSSVILADAKGKAIPLVTQRGAIVVNVMAASSSTASAPQLPDTWQPVRDFIDWLTRVFGLAR